MQEAADQTILMPAVQITLILIQGTCLDNATNILRYFSAWGILIFFKYFYCIGVLAKQGQHNRFSCSTNIPALKEAELVRCVAAEGMNIDQILITNHLPIKLSEERVGKLAFIGQIQC